MGILSNQRARNVPQNGVQTNYVPHVRYRWGTKSSPLQDTYFCGVFEKKLKNLTTPIFLVGLIYRWGKGPKTKKYMYKCDFSYTICEKIKNIFFFTFLTF